MNSSGFLLVSYLSPINCRGDPHPATSRLRRFWPRDIVVTLLGSTLEVQRTFLGSKGGAMDFPWWTMENFHDDIPIETIENWVSMGISMDHYHLVMAVTDIAMERSSMLLRTVNHLFRLGLSIPWLCEITRGYGCYHC